MHAVQARRLSEFGERAVDVPITCSITRFGLRSARSLLPCYLDYRRLSEASRRLQPDGLLQWAFLLEHPRAWYSFSIWSGTPAFSAQVPDHIAVANRMFGRLAYEDDRGLELWTTKWRLVSVTNNLNWGDFNLRELITNDGLATSAD